MRPAGHHVTELNREKWTEIVWIIAAEDNGHVYCQSGMTGEPFVSFGRVFALG